MRKIFKYMLPASHGYTMISVPKGAVPISVDEQYNAVSMWMEVAHYSKRVDMEFFICQTGRELPPVPMEFVGTVLMNKGSQVVHIYKIKTSLGG